MSTTDTTWYIGPSGGLVALPDLEGATRSRDKIQAISRGATGARTINSTGYRRSWSLTVEGLTRHEQSLLHALDEGVVAGPIRLIDPLSVNIMKPRVASTFSSYGSMPPFQPAILGVQVNPEPSDSTFPLSPRHRYFARAENTSGSASEVFIGPWSPILASTQYTFSMYMKPTATATITAYQKNTSDVESVLTTATQAASASWVRFSMSVTPGSTIKELRFSFSIANGQVQDVAGIQLERGTLSDWVPGDGVPEVQITDMPETNPHYFYGNYTLNIVEL